MYRRFRLDRVIRLVSQRTCWSYSNLGLPWSTNRRRRNGNVRRWQVLWTLSFALVGSILCCAQINWYVLLTLFKGWHNLWPNLPSLGIQNIRHLFQKPKLLYCSFIFVSDKWFLCLCFIYLMQASDYCWSLLFWLGSFASTLKLREGVWRSSLLLIGVCGCCLLLHREFVGISL